MTFIPLGTLAPGTAAKAPSAFHVMLKPTGAICNLDCTYCFYLDKEQLYPGDTRFRMTEEVLESFTRQYLEAQRVPEVTFAFQGGEPTLMGLDFYRKAVELQQKFRKPGTRVINALQTNGVLLDEDWARFLKQHRFLVGLSLDGPEHLHDAFRVDKGGNATWPRVMRALGLLKAHGVDWNLLCVVNRRNGDYPTELYRFFREHGAEFLQFIPAVERPPEGGVSDWSVGPEQWGDFLSRVFDLWVRHDVGRVYVQHFDVALQAWLGLEPGLCVHAETCGNCLAMEHNGDLFSCDHYVSPQHYLGNVTQASVAGLVGSPFQRKFGTGKRDTLTRQCRECPVRFACNGGCPKDRFSTALDGEPGHNYLCAGYERFFKHIDGPMQTMADLYRRGRPPAAIMEQYAAAARRRAGRNDPCPCGSGQKHKRCCAGRAGA